MPCNAKDCKVQSIMPWNVSVRGFIGKTDVHLCETHTGHLYEKEVKLKNGGQIDRI